MSTRREGERAGATKNKMHAVRFELTPPTRRAGLKPAAGTILVKVIQGY